MGSKVVVRAGDRRRDKGGGGAETRVGVGD